MILTKSPIFLLDPAEPMLGLAYVPLFSPSFLLLLGWRNVAPLAPLLFSAVFKACNNLKVAEGTFSGSVGFKKPGLEKTRNLITYQINLWRIAAKGQKSQPEIEI